MGVTVLAVLVQKFSEIVVLGRPHLRPHPRRPRTPAGHENDEFGRCRHGPILGFGKSPSSDILSVPSCGGLINIVIVFLGRYRNLEMRSGDVLNRV